MEMLLPAFEPCPGRHDRPDLAMYNRYSILEPYGSYEWLFLLRGGR
jgi:hypothetical protein